MLCNFNSSGFRCFSGFFDHFREAVTLGELGGAVEGPYPISKTRVCSFVQGVTG